MKIWRNDKLEEYSPEEMHNDISTTIKNYLEANSLIYEIVDCPIPMIQRSIWKNDPQHRTEFLIRSFMDNQDDFSVAAEYEILYPADKSVRGGIVFAAPYYMRQVPELLQEIVEYYQKKESHP